MNEFNSTDKKIMRATFRILQKEGFAKATTKKIAAEAEVNEVTIFRKFQNKNNLVETTKEYYLQILLKQLEEIFDFNEDDEIDDYFQKNFIELLDRSDKDFRIVKIALEEVREIPDKKQLISRITDTVINKLEDFFKLQIEKGKIRAVDSRVLAGMCFSLTFQSVILWKIYDKSQDVESDQIAREFLDILYNGIKA
ncbi:TetR/AcrR family transcriptional regulator [Methanobrevibacter sp.]|uniref:TetR/AcrR family transcriptional regulator n=1 Tax=Methanobrevibacter sp. TaxID=66852 RepID=UPI0025CE103C|nr:helix-turn-helix domain-containing protein [Methanobrevibacter sp.]MBQ6512469.1 TetR/AcrR family transcriptional regulator [Methanobrevibacter sp.]